MEGCNKVLGVLHGGRGEPGVFRVGIALPFDEILDAPTVTGETGLKYCFKFKVAFFIIDYFRWWTREVGAVSRGLFVGH